MFNLLDISPKGCLRLPEPQRRLGFAAEDMFQASASPRFLHLTAAEHAGGLFSYWANLAIILGSSQAVFSCSSLQSIAT